MSEQQQPPPDVQAQQPQAAQTDPDVGAAQQQAGQQPDPDAGINVAGKTEAAGTTEAQPSSTDGILRGVTAATKFHRENTGLPYPAFVIKEDNAFKQVRILQPPSEWVSVFIHRDWESKLPATRCASSSEEPDMEKCTLCAFGVGRQLRTFIPVRVRQDDVKTRVQMVDYGRDNLMGVLAQIEELPQGLDATMIDYKVKRQGKGTDTKYWWVQCGNQRPLSDAERELKIPNIPELLAIPTEAQQKALVQRLKPKADGDSGTGGGGDRTPF